MKPIKIAAAAAAVALSLTACGGGPGAQSGGDDKVLTVSAWGQSTGSEFDVLAKGFEAKNPGVKVELKQYDSKEYNTVLTADLAAKAGPDIITQKEASYITTLQGGGQLADLSDLPLPEGISGLETYAIDGKQYAVPYRNDGWLLYYNKELFKAAGVAEPDGSWTWDDYSAAAVELTKKLESTPKKPKGDYQHTWQSTVQGFAVVQTPGADLLSGKFGYLKPFYERSLTLQKDGAQVDYNTAKANQLTYPGEFGKQNAAMLLMGTWFTASLVAEQKKGVADDFEWGIAPAPQFDSSTTGMGKSPVTFGNPTGFGVNAALQGPKLQLAKDFVAYAASEEGALALAGIGIRPALSNDKVVDAYFAVEGAPSDELSKFAIGSSELRPENPPSKRTVGIQGILDDLHSAVMSGSEPVDSAITAAQDRVANEIQ